MDIREAIRAVIAGRDLDAAEMAEVITGIMTGTATPSQIAGLLVALRMKGETVAEISGAARAMRALARPVRVPGADPVDIVGTGGDSSGTFNVSTACALVVAAAGARVAKHGNRSVSSHSGSADLLEALGIRIDLEPEQVARCVAETGFGFMFAPLYHGAMRHAMPPRRELGIRTIFNVLGPLTNPAGARRLLIGVFAGQWVEPLARVHAELGSRHVLVVHSEDGMDELSINAPSRVAELKDGEVRCFTLDPGALGVRPGAPERLRVDGAAASRDLILSIFRNEPGPAREMVRLNAGAALYVAGLRDDIGGGMALADEVIASGKPLAKIDQLARLTGSFPP